MDKFTKMGSVLRPIGLQESDFVASNAISKSVLLKLCLLRSDYSRLINTVQGLREPQFMMWLELEDIMSNKVSGMLELTDDNPY